MFVLVSSANDHGHYCRAAGILQCAAASLVATSNTNSSNGSSGVFTLGGHVVRDVAPNKLMICLTFILPREVSLWLVMIMPSMFFKKTYL
jgi:hypothetical protein